MKHEADEELIDPEFLAEEPEVAPEPEPEVAPEPEPEPELQGILINKGSSNLTIEIQTMTPKSSARMRRAAPFMVVALSVTPKSSVDVKKALNCSAADAVKAIKNTPFITKLVHRGLLEII